MKVILVYKKRGSVKSENLVNYHRFGRVFLIYPFIGGVVNRTGADVMSVDIYPRVIMLCSRRGVRAYVNTRLAVELICTCFKLVGFFSVPSFIGR